MYKLFFVVDFVYNPSAQKPLTVLELGDALTAGWVTQPIGAPKKNVGDFFLEDLKKQYPNALLLLAFPAGLDLLDLSNGRRLLTYDKNDLYTKSVQTQVPSYQLMLELIGNIIETAATRSSVSRMLLISMSPTAFYELGLDSNDITPTSSLKLVNLFSPTLHSALYNKSVYHEFANNSPIYPKTILLYGNEHDHDKLNNFLSETMSDYYVIKPTNATRSEGVHIVAKNQLKRFISTIREEKRSGSMNNSLYKDGMLVQICHLSKKIVFRGKPFHAKGRAVIQADFKKKDAMPVLNFLTGYWQLANQSCEQGVNDKTAIAFGAANKEGVIEIEEKDWSRIKGLLSDHLSPILQAMAKQATTCFCGKGFSDPAAETSIALKKFLKQQILFPYRSDLMKNIYLSTSIYWEDSHYRKLTKEFVVDLLGLDPAIKANIHRDTQSIDKFVDNAILTRDCKKESPLELANPWAYRFQSAKNWLVFIFIELIVLSLFANKPIVLTISLLALSGLLLEKHKEINKKDSFKNFFFEQSAGSRLEYHSVNSNNNYIKN